MSSEQDLCIGQIQRVRTAPCQVTHLRGFLTHIGFEAQRDIAPLDVRAALTERRAPDGAVAGSLPPSR